MSLDPIFRNCKDTGVCLFKIQDDSLLFCDGRKCHKLPTLDL